MQNIRILLKIVILFATTNFSFAAKPISFDDTVRDLIKNGNFKEFKKLISDFQIDRSELGEELLQATFLGRRDFVEYLVREKRVNTEQRNGQGETPLMIAAARGDLDVVKFLDKNGANIDEFDETGDSAFSKAAAAGQLEILKYLVQRQVVYLRLNKMELSALELSAGKCHLEVVRYLIEELSYDRKIRHTKSDLALRHASWVCCTDVVEFLLCRNGTTEQDKITVLHEATQNSCLNLVMRLEEMEVDLKARNVFDETVLMLVARGGSKELLDYFLGKNTTEVDAIANGGYSALFFAIDAGSLEIVETLVMAGANIDLQDVFGKTPLMHSVFYNEPKIAKYLAKKGANLFLKDGRSRDVSFYTAFDKHLDILDFLVREFNISLDSRDEDNSTLLHMAVQNDAFQVLKFLVKKGLDRNVVDASGKRPVDYMRGKYSTQFLTWLTRDVRSFIETIEIKLDETNINETMTAMANETVMLYCKLQCLRCSIRTTWFFDDGQLPSENFIEELLTSENFIQKDDYIVALKATNYFDKYFTCQGETDSDIFKRRGKLVQTEIPNGSKNKPLLAAISEGDLDVVKYYLEEKNIDPFLRIPQNLQETLLHIAARDGRLSVVQYLVKEKLLVVERTDNSRKITALHLAAYNGHLEVIKFLVDSGVTPLRDYVASPIFQAVHSENTEVVKVLLRNGSKLENEEGSTALHAACTFKNLKQVKFLVEELKMDVDAKDSSGLSPLHLSADLKLLNILGYLIFQGADVTLPDKRGENVLFHAVKQRDFEAMQAILRNSSGFVYNRNFFNETVFDVALEIFFTDGLKYLFELTKDTELLDQFITKIDSRKSTEKDESMLNFLDDIKSQLRLQELIFWSRIFGPPVVGILVIILFYWIYKTRKTIRDMREAGLDRFEEGAIDEMNPDLNLNDQAELLPYNPKFEVPRENIKLGKPLGAGAFGVVLQAIVQNILPHERETTVAVKMVKPTTDNQTIRALVCELKIMVHVGKHLNVVNLLGAVTKNIVRREMMIIVEYCAFGSVEDFLEKHRSSFIDLINRESDEIIFPSLEFLSPLSERYDNLSQYKTFPRPVLKTPENSVSTFDLVCWSFQVARGMQYLSSRKVLHGDLAARNILLASGNVAKICDFGLARSLYKRVEYEKQSDGLLPVKWMAIESLKFRLFSTASDVWAFGVTMWEFFSLAEEPYLELSGFAEVFPRIRDGLRLQKPRLATGELYAIMRACWEEEPKQRPTFSNLEENLGRLLEPRLLEYFTNLNAGYEKLNEVCKQSGEDVLALASDPTKLPETNLHQEA